MHRSTYGKPHSAEWNEKVAASKRGKPLSEEHKRAISESKILYHLYHDFKRREKHA